MPKKWVYTTRGKTQNYSTEELENAVKAVKEGSVSIRKASSLFGIPKSTLGDRISGKHALHARNGRPPHIPEEVENKIVDSVKMAARRGIGLTRKQILARTSIMCDRLKIASQHTTFNAGKDWWEGVKRRHPDLVIRKPEKLASTRARMMNREVINKYFKDLGTIIEGLNIQDKPQLIWNCDELGKNFEHDPVKIVAEKGEKTCLSKTSSKSNNITVMACVNASGRRMPPMFIAKGKTSRSLHGFNTSSAPPGTRWCYQHNGWIDDKIGEKWFTDVFLEFCGSERPQLLILDGHSSHESLGILMQAIEANIHILALPPHTTHALQPLDKAVFGPLNRAYNEVCSAFLQENSLHQVNKWTFPALFRQAWDKAVTGANIRSGFRACGIYPLNSSAIPEQLFNPSIPTDKPLGPSVGVSKSLSPIPVELDNRDRNNVLGDKSAIDFRDQPVISQISSTTTSNEVYFASPSSIISPLSSSDNSSLDPCLNDGGSFDTSFEDIYDGASASCDSSEIDTCAQSTPDILDISDPFRLFELISDGSVLVKPMFQENKAELVIQNNTPSAVESAVIMEQKTENNESIESKVEAFFIPPAATFKTKPKSKGKSVTHHRLLTSEDIINEKLRMETLKSEKEKKKNSRMNTKTTSNKRAKTEKML